MDRIKIHSLALLLVILAILPETESQRHRPLPLPMVPSVPPRPLCVSQFSLVNYACAMLPYSPAPPVSPPSPPLRPTPPSPPDDDVESSRRHGHGHGHGHRHRHRHRHGYGDGHQATPQEENCCRWLKEVDNECVCDMLVHLPAFLSRPIHQYSVIVDDSCNVTFTCGGRLRPMEIP
ncbi:hypothetical protein Ddye_016724 [Dipteronia dyeriana]|uniref:Bifunctional inhibitor/plant lipid transfer protein/seed storage helical domain-containing protein n=1 Tax=Dipteronia dyeriana TaxID=168575 RepID=A0AAD9U794_9ROSI|nr:hypothetical protein Ddye_016724 [Dipteronia dyeriana]